MDAGRLKAVVAEAIEGRGVFGISGHAARRMIERGIPRPAVIATLLRGLAVEGPALDVRGRWRATFWHGATSVEVAVAVSPDPPPRVTVVTVYERRRR